MSADNSVRRAQAADAIACGELIAQQMRERIRRVNPEVESVLAAHLKTETLAASWREAITEADKEIVLVALEGEEVVGFAAALALQDEPTGAEIIAFAVKEGARGKGHGSRLLQALVDTLRTRYEKLQVWIAKEERLRIEFFAGAGFGPLGASRSLNIGAKADPEALWGAQI